MTVSRLACVLAVLATLPGCSCGGPSGGRDTGPRRDSGPRADAGLDEDAGSSVDDPDTGGGGMDAFLDPLLDADLDAFDPSRVDADQDVGPIDAFEHDAGAASGPTDVGLVRDDAERPRDVGADVRPPTGACGILWDRGDPLPEECTPRCSRDTRDLFAGCSGDATCEAYVMVRDTTRTGLLFVWDDFDVTEVDCESCVGTQRYSCWYEHCASQADEWVDCVAVRMSEACAREREILDRCLLPHRTEVNRCASERVPMCFPD
jgi:hypothetical protein